MNVEPLCTRESEGRRRLLFLSIFGDGTINNRLSVPLAYFCLRRFLDAYHELREHDEACTAKTYTASEAADGTGGSGVVSGGSSDAVRCQTSDHKQMGNWGNESVEVFSNALVRTLRKKSPGSRSGSRFLHTTRL